MKLDSCAGNYGKSGQTRGKLGSSVSMSGQTLVIRNYPK